MILPTLLALSAIGGTPRVAPHEDGPLNIVVFMVDDLGWQDVSEPFHDERTPFNERYRTPNVESLAERGMKFTQAYAAAPVCTPTRTSLMTGRSPGQMHITYWTLHAGRDQSARFPGVSAPDWNVNALQPEDMTLPRLLGDAGYHTIHVGKAHLGAKGTPGEDPTRLGFDVNVAGHGAGGPGSFLGEKNFKGRNPVWDVPGLEAYHGQEIFLTEALAAEACKRIEKAVQAEHPFFLHMAPYAVHAPITANARYSEHYKELDRREAAYATMIETVDAALGLILAKLRELEVEQRTIVIFTSDNGGLSAHARGGEAHTHNAPLRSGKGSAYEGGVRVPQIIAWPGVTDSGGVSHENVITYDLFPTILAMARVPIPVEHRPRVEGLDLGGLLRGTQTQLEERGLFWHQPHFWGVKGPGIWPFSAIREGRWKLIYRHGDRGFELYDLEQDLGETRNLAEEQPQRLRALAERLSTWCEQRGVQMSVDEKTGEPIELPRARLPE